MLLIDDCNTARSRRLFFDEYASEHDFNPLIPENWFAQSRSKIMHKKVYFYFTLSISLDIVELLLILLY